MTTFDYSLLEDDDPAQIHEIFAKGPSATRQLPADLIFHCGRAKATKCLKALVDHGYHANTWWVGTLSGTERTPGFKEIYGEAGLRMGECTGALLEAGQFSMVRDLLIDGHRALSGEGLHSSLGADLIKSILLLNPSPKLEDDFVTENKSLSVFLLALAARHPRGERSITLEARAKIDQIKETMQPGSEKYRIFYAYESALTGIDPEYRALCLSRAFPQTHVAGDFAVGVLPTLGTGAGWATLLLDAGLPIESLNEQGNTLADGAIQRGDIEGAKVYINAGARITGTFDDPAAPQSTHSTSKARVMPLLLQIEDPDTRLAALREFPILKFERSRDGSTALMGSISCDPALSISLLDAGVDVSAVDRCGWSALHHATYSATLLGLGRSNLVERILSAGADPDQADRMGFVPAEIIPREWGGAGSANDAFLIATMDLLDRTSRQRRLTSALDSASPPEADARPKLDIL